MKVVYSLFLFVLTLPTAYSHGYLTSPLPRQYRDSVPSQAGWNTNWVGITVPGDESIVYGEGNAANNNAGIGGGMGGAQRELDEGHGLCGDIGSRHIFSDGQYGTTEPRMTVDAGGVLPISVKVTAYHAGWFEFRLCSPDQFGGLTQDCLNQNVLKIDASTPYYPAILDYANMKGISGAGGNGDWYKCGKSPNQIWPSGSCCYDGGHCSDEANNDDRYVLEFAAGGGAKVYDIKLQVPNDVVCDNCVLQWFYQTANSRETYPESFWNCADIQVGGTSGPINPVTPTPRPTMPPTPVVVQPAQPTASPPTSSPPTQTSTTPPPSPAVMTTPPSAVMTAPPTSGNTDNGACGTCKGCWWTVVASNIGCYSDWSESLCAVYQNSGYQWCQ